MNERSVDIFERKYLADFNPREPFVWRLKLPYARFEELEALVETYPDCLSENPVAAIVYLAEWYKWRKTGAAKQTRKYNPDTAELKQMIEKAGIDIDRYVAINPETGRHAWLYSIYAFGGLPMMQELERSKPSKFLMQICRLYHGEDIDLEEDSKDAGRSVAFKKGMEEGGAVYAFLKNILEGGMPFSDEDYKDPGSLVSRFIQRLTEVNKETLRDKYNLYWTIYCPQGSQYISRSLEIRLANEPNGLGMHQYLPYDRVMSWGFMDPQELRFIRLGVRFLNGENEIGVVPKVGVYTNTGLQTKGFLCWNVEDAIRVREVPVADFSEVELIATGSNGETRTVQRFQWRLPMQLFRTGKRNEWTSRTLSQNDTAALWRTPWQTTESLTDGLNDQRIMKNRKEEDPEKPFNFTYVPESLTLAYAGDLHTFHNRKGHIRLESTMHCDTIRYEEGDKVRFIETDEDGDETEELLPVVFTILDLKAEEYSKEREETETLKIERVEWKNGARYEEWNEETIPPTGKIKLRCEIKGRMLIREFVYLGGNAVRDIEKQEIHYPGGIYKDKPDMEDSKPLRPTVELELPLDSGKAILSVWRPINLNEVNSSDRCWRREKGERFSIPLLESDRIWVSVFDAKGYRRYDCAPLRAVYFGLDSNRRWSLIDHSTPIAANSIDPLAPESLDIVMAYPGHEAPEDTEWMSWDYSVETEPKNQEYTAEMPTLTLLFKNRKGIENPLDVYSAVRGARNGFKVKKILNAQTRLKCFELASEYNEYYAAFLPLNEMTEGQFNEEIRHPILQQYGGNLPKRIKHAMKRAAEELGFIRTELK